MKKINPSKIDAMTSICNDGKRELKELLKEADLLEAEPEVGRWLAPFQETYYIITDANDTTTHAMSYNGDPCDYSAFNRGNMFRDKATAKLFAKKRAARNRLELLAYELNGQEVVGLDNGISYVIARPKDSSPGVYACSYCEDQILFKTRDLAEKAIELTSNEDLITLFGVGKE